MSALTEFLSFQEPNVRYVVAGTTILGASSAIVGTFSFLRNRSLVGDVIAHSILPGICLAFMLTGTKNPLVLIVGAAITGWLSLLFIDFITKHSKLKPDTAIGLTLSFFFGIGIMLLTSIQHGGNAAQSGLDKFLFGKAASLTPFDTWVFGIVGAILIIVVLVFYKEFKLFAFNPDYAQVIGLPVKTLEFAITSITVLAVAVGIQAVGVVLMAALLITPAAGARFWSDKLHIMLIIATIFGAFSGLTGSFVSYTAPAMPTGPWIVMSLSVLALGSVFLAPKKGLIAKFLRHKENENKILTENILKLFYHLGEKDEDFRNLRTESELLAKRPFSRKKFHEGLRKLKRKGFLIHQIDKWGITEKGLTEARHVIRLHRLWELYLTQKLKLPADHVHPDAEAIEHIITPELEVLLEKELSFPIKDPHNKNIPGFR